MSKTNNKSNLDYSAKSILNAIHRSESSDTADIKILVESIEKFKNQEAENVRYALGPLKRCLEDENKSKLSKRDDQIFAHYAKRKFSS